MLGRWLVPGSVEDFLRDRLGKEPWARPSAATEALPYFDWETLGRVLGAQPAPDLITVLRGRLVDRPAPRTLDEAKRDMAEGLGFVIRRAERNDPALAQLAGAFAADLPGKINVQLFVTRAGTNGFAWHYDFEEVFIVQTAGVKDYYFRENTVDLTTPIGTQPSFEKFRDERGPLRTARLCPGDWLYIPSRWWHMARCQEDSLSISIGVLPAGRS
jgi:50S ribosomal protein L16 3-hydroxylase